MSTAGLILRAMSRTSRRFFTSKQLVFRKTGKPLEVVELETTEVEKVLGPRDVRIRYLAAPVNPADINQIEGTYPLPSPLPLVGGNEGLGEVEKVGNDVKGLQKGDWVILAHSGLGSWQTRAQYSEDDLMKIDNRIPLEIAATLQVNPPTAYRMLTDFVDLKPGDLVVQNGASTTVGRAVIQIAHARGLRTVNVVEKRDDLEQLVGELKSLGADVVITEDEVKAESKTRAKDARLALNCVGGRSALMLTTCLGHKGVMVTYGGLSKQAIQIPTGQFIFKDITSVGFWMSKWYTRPENKEKRDIMLKDIAELVLQGKFKPPNLDKHKLDGWKTAFERSLSGAYNKQIFIL